MIRASFRLAPPPANRLFCSLISTAMKFKRVTDLLRTEAADQTVEVRGWVRTRRGNKQIAFIAVNDGSVIHSIQVVAEMAKFPEELIKRVTTGACIRATGKLVASQGSGQAVEIQAETIEILGDADESYPLQKKGHTLEFLREIAHLRPRTNTFGAVFRLRHHMAFAIHKYFNDRGFFYLHSPIITGSDAEGAGEMFQVTTLDLQNLPKLPDGSINFKEDFFGKSTNLTVSGQLEGELAATALGNVYTFGPTFRAEHSNTSRHAGGVLDDRARDRLRRYQRRHRRSRRIFIKYLVTRVRDGAVSRMTSSSSTKTLSSDQSFKALQGRHQPRSSASPGTRRSASWSTPSRRAAPSNSRSSPGSSCSPSTRTSWPKTTFKRPVIVTNYPGRSEGVLHAARRRPRASDRAPPWIILVPAHRRDHRRQPTRGAARRARPPPREPSRSNPATYWWYRELRQVWLDAVHAGFGLGFERLMLWMTGMKNIRDVHAVPAYAEERGVLIRVEQSENPGRCRTPAGVFFFQELHAPEK
jgi:asparaginyl-tRNA synthetase